MSCKILCTLGPSSDTKDEIQNLLSAGANAFRLNFSHGIHEEHKKRIATIRTLEQQVGAPISIVADMQGAKFRVGTFANGTATLVEGAPFTLYKEREGVGDEHGVSFPHPEIFSVVQRGTNLAIDDGILRLTVTKVLDDALETIVSVGGVIGDRKGVNVPGVQIPLDGVIPKDRDDITFACAQGVDWIALSFVQTPEDVLQARELIPKQVKIISKIEKPSAVTSIDAIIDVSNAIMVARGDLGVEMPPEEVPYTQKMIVTKCRQAGKPVIVATQLLDSMIRQPLPTRAEVSDVANAIYDGADICMLSGETASGKYPVEAVSTMRKVIARSENHRFDVVVQVNELFAGRRGRCVACQQAEEASAKALIFLSDDAEWVAQCASQHPGYPILCVTTKEATARQLALVWGVTGVMVESPRSTEEVARQTVLDRRLVQKGDTIFVVGSGSVRQVTV